jgi:hypothetical protein
MSKTNHSDCETEKINQICDKCIDRLELDFSDRTSSSQLQRWTLEPANPTWGKSPLAPSISLDNNLFLRCLKKERDILGKNVGTRD